MTDTETGTQVRAAALNNAAWCDVVCVSHEVRTITSGQFWVALQRTPPFYPDAISLTENVRPANLLKLIQDSPGASIKDSFADLDLREAGYAVLFSADWIFRASAGDATELPPGWRVLTDPDELTAWSQAAGLRHVVLPALLDHPDVRILAGRDAAGRTAGAILNRSGSVVGVSNVFSADMDADQVWSGVVQAAGACFPGLALCGYERGSDLQDALRAGFQQIGPLRVWGRS